VRLILELALDWIWYRPNLVKWLLWPLGNIYRVAMEIRRLQYRLGLKPVTTLPVPVIVVGNITVGGTGKTPLVIWLASELQTRGYRVGIVSRGYGGSAADWPQQVWSTSDPLQVGDEPVLLARATGCPVAVGPDRVAAAQMLLATERVDVVLTDDGLQHHALNRTMEIIVVDGERGLGNGFFLPAGPLRESKSRIDDVDAVVVNGGSWGHDGVFRAQAEGQRLYQVAGPGQKSLGEFRGTKVHAVAGIANPTRFFDLLEKAGISVLPYPLPDHAKLDATSLDFGDSLPIMVTEKDAVKCQSFAHENVWCVPIKLIFDARHRDLLMQRVLTHLT
tara:strand:+ start:201 stop:1199 length:999 start_codon:yes stop_codon:yes gene_type:complete